MLYMYLFFLTIKIVSASCAMYFRMRMIFFKNTDTYSNMCFVAGYVFALSGMVVGLQKVVDIAYKGNLDLLIQLYGTSNVVVGQVLAAGVFVSFLMGTLRKYTLSKPS